MQPGEKIPEVRVTVEPSDKELVIRTGQASPIELPQSLELSGAIDSVTRFVEKRRNTLDPFQTHVYYNRTAWAITLVSEEREVRHIEIKGTLGKSKDLGTFAINSGTRTDPKAMANFMRTARRFFPDRSQNEKLIENLSKFVARVETEIKAIDDRKGHVLASIERKLTHEIPLTFKLRLNLFEGIKSEAEFNVEVVPDITDGGVKFYLESVELTEILEARKDAIIEFELDKLRDYVIITTW